jgi:hypothetical protein
MSCNKSCLVSWKQTQDKEKEKVVLDASNEIGYLWHIGNVLGVFKNICGLQVHPFCHSTKKIHCVCWWCSMCVQPHAFQENVVFV